MSWIRSAQGALKRYENVIQLASVSSLASSDFPPGTGEAGQDTQNGNPNPRVRSIVIRDLLSPPSLTSLPVDNLDETEHPFIVSTTDTLSLKVSELAQDATIELVWWIASTQEQLRVRGRAYIVGPPNGSEDAEGSLRDQSLPPALNHIKWEHTRLSIFENKIGPALRASWLRPIYGTPKASYPSSPAASLPEKLPDSEKGSKDWLRALERFALVVIDPEVVERLELAVVPNLRTVETRRKDDKGRWDKEEWVL